MGLGVIEDFGIVANQVNWSLTAISIGLRSPLANIPCHFLLT